MDETPQARPTRHSELGARLEARRGRFHHVSERERHVAVASARLRELLEEQMQAKLDRRPFEREAELEAAEAELAAAHEADHGYTCSGAGCTTRLDPHTPHYGLHVSSAFKTNGHGGYVDAGFFRDPETGAGLPVVRLMFCDGCFERLLEHLEAQDEAK